MTYNEEDKKLLEQLRISWEKAYGEKPQEIELLLTGALLENCQGATERKATFKQILKALQLAVVAIVEVEKRISQDFERSVADVKKENDKVSQKRIRRIH